MAKLAVDLKPTEDVEKVKRAVLRLFPDAKLKASAKKISGSASLENFFKLAKQQHIRSSLFSAARENLKGENGSIALSKMAACAGMLGLDEDFPLGKICVSAPLKEFEAGLSDI